MFWKTLAFATLLMFSVLNAGRAYEPQGLSLTLMGSYLDCMEKTEALENELPYVKLLCPPEEQLKELSISRLIDQGLYPVPTQNFLTAPEQLLVPERPLRLSEEQLRQPGELSTGEEEKEEPIPEDIDPQMIEECQENRDKLAAALAARKLKCRVIDVVYAGTKGKTPVLSGYEELAIQPATYPTVEVNGTISCDHHTFSPPDHSDLKVTVTFIGEPIKFLTIIKKGTIITKKKNLSGDSCESNCAGFVRTVLFNELSDCFKQFKAYDLDATEILPENASVSGLEGISAFDIMTTEGDIGDNDLRNAWPSGYFPIAQEIGSVNMLRAEVLDKCVGEYFKEPNLDHCKADCSYDEAQEISIFSSSTSFPNKLRYTAIADKMIFRDWPATDQLPSLFSNLSPGKTLWIRSTSNLQALYSGGKKGPLTFTTTSGLDENRITIKVNINEVSGCVME